MRIIRRLLWLTVVLVALLWLLAEVALVQGARKLAADGVITLDRAAMLADPRRIGARLEGVTLDGAASVPEEAEDGTAAGALTLSDAVFWVAPWRPNLLHIDLPAAITFPAPDIGPIRLGLKDPHLQAKLSPRHRMGLVAGEFRLDTARLEDQPLAGPSRITADLIAADQEFAGRPAAAYRIAFDISQLYLSALAPFLPSPAPPPEGDLSATGAVTVWLDEVIGPGSADPVLRGFGLAGPEIRIDDAALRIWGQVGIGTTGEVEGQIVFDSPDLRGFVLALRDGGLIPPDHAHLIATAFETIARESRNAAPEFLPQPQTGHIIPEPEDGIERVPLRLSGGEIFLGDVPLLALLARGQ